MSAVRDEHVPARTGTCPLCDGKIVERMDVKEGSHRHSMTSAGLHCSKCGIKYEFIPPEGVLER